MNLDQIASRIAQPDTCLGSEILALKTLTEKYPFAQVFSILYLKALASQNDIGFDEALQKHAYRVTDRMKLYDLIHSVDQQDEIRRDVINHVPTENPLPVPEKNESIETFEESIPVNEKSIDDNSNETTDRDAIVRVPNPPEIETPPIEPKNIESPKNLTDAIHPVSADLEENEITVPDFATDFIQDEVELEIISQVVATVYNDNLEHSIPELPIEEKKSEPLTTPSAETEDGLLESKRSFSSWLKAGHQNAPVAENQPSKEIEKELKETEKQIDKIIERFIEKEPTISRPKKEFYSPSKKAKESVSSEGLIYTETLADIFAIQGNFPKAITAYQQLMLTNPEKKIFFAQRIKELQEKLNT